jgi:hypothetical protein
MGRKVPLRCFVRLHRKLLRPFSDSLVGVFSEVPCSYSCPPDSCCRKMRLPS